MRERKKEAKKKNYRHLLLLRCKLNSNISVVSLRVYVILVSAYIHINKDVYIHTKIIEYHGVGA
jgi:hypothetical protein